MRPPQVLREGTKKTVFVNFMDLCKTYFSSPQTASFGVNLSVTVRVILIWLHPIA
jgi:hypothetical protein